MSRAGRLGGPHHDGSELYVPQGVPTLGDQVPVRLRVPAAFGERAVHLRTVRDGEPHLVQARLDRSDAHERWYVAEVDLHNPVTSYRFLLDEPAGYRWLNGRGLHAREVPDAGDFRLTVHGRAPAWAADAVVYQVFPDRFARSGAVRDLPAWAEPAAWDDEPRRSGAMASTQFYGGDLTGIEQRLDHLTRLGVDVLYLTPFFPARSNHRYDASTFDHVDPLLGGDPALASLSRAVHARGMRLIGDLTTNHTGAGHEWFARALADPAGPEAGYYHWHDSGAHVGWLGHASLPKLDHRDPALAARMIEGPQSVIARWLREPFALDGWRIDVANMTGRYRDVDLTHAVARTVRATMAAENPEALLVSEHFHDAGADLSGDGWHANMNYTGFTRPIWDWLAPEQPRRTMPGLPVETVRRPGSASVATMTEFASAVPWAVTARQWNLLGSHDTPRIATMAASRALVEVGVGLLMTYPGTPVIFAGDEIGATGDDGEHARVTMPWDSPARWDAATFEVYRSLIAVRRGSRALRDGGLRWLVVDDDALVYLRETSDERVLVAVSRAPWAGVELPGHLVAAGAAPQTLHGPDLVPAGGPGGAGRTGGSWAPGGFSVPGDGPGVGAWRLG